MRDENLPGSERAHSQRPHPDGATHVDAEAPLTADDLDQRPSTSPRRARRGRPVIPSSSTLTREQRLRRTMVGAGVLVLLAGGATMALQQDEPAVAPRATTTPTPSSAEPGAKKPTPTRTGTPGLPLVQKGTGRYTVVPVTAPKPPARGRAVRYTVEAEGGLGTDNAEFARLVAAFLADKRGWQSKEGVRFVNVTPAQAAGGSHVDVRVTLASPDRVNQLCAPLRTRGMTSCFNRGRAVINSRRWLLGADSYKGQLATYRVYVINHEVGHSLGHGHVGCPAQGHRAPVMLQQTLGLQGCTRWPYPVGA